MKFEAITSACVVLPQDDIDTDQIIPARFLAGVDRDGLADGLFHGLRAGPTFPLNDPALRHAKILVAGRNFGCGSSREHAVWALYDWGFRAVIAASFGDIFRANALKNGLLPVTLSAMPSVASGARVTVDLRSLRVSMPGATLPFELEPFAQRCLLDGVDELGYLLARRPQISAFEEGRP